MAVAYLALSGLQCLFVSMLQAGHFVFIVSFTFKHATALLPALLVHRRLPGPVLMCGPSCWRRSAAHHCLIYEQCLHALQHWIDEHRCVLLTMQGWQCRVMPGALVTSSHTCPSVPGSA